jgi:hypothetical protein
MHHKPNAAGSCGVSAGPHASAGEDEIPRPWETAVGNQAFQYEQEMAAEVGTALWPAPFDQAQGEPTAADGRHLLHQGEEGCPRTARFTLVYKCLKATKTGMVQTRVTLLDAI